MKPRIWAHLKTGQQIQEVAFLAKNDIMKYEIAQELGLADKVDATGWKSLTARESGRIGGILVKRKRMKEAE
jgi:hypothetical protein